MKFFAVSLLLVAMVISIAMGTNHTETSRENVPPPPIRQLSMEKISRIMRTEASEVCTSADAKNHALITEALGTNLLMNLYNKDDMSCFALRSTVADIHALPENFEAIPILPEMKIPQGTMEAISGSDISVGRIEIILCPGVQDLDALLAEVEYLAKGTQTGGRRQLRVDNFVTSRSHVFETKHPWHRALGNKTVDCNDMLSHAGVDSFGDTILFAIPPSYRGVEWRSCLQMLLADIALQDDVCFVGAYEDPQILNDLASGIIQSGSPGSKPMYDVGLDGSGQVVALSDSGIDIDNCYFYDSDQSTPKSPIGTVKGPVNPLARKVIQYVSFADDSDYANGHGRSIAGRRSDNGLSERFGDGDGVAKAAKLAFFDIGESNNGLRVPLISTVLAAGYEDAGARIHSASWGSPRQNSYSSYDHSADSFMYNNPDFLFIVAAGNSGRDRPLGSIASPGLNKNGITVGAAQNSLPHIQNDMLGPEYLAEFSSRGPTGDGRSKPEVVAPGMYIESARAQPDSKGECDNSGGLSFKAGTSMAAPLVSGSAALVRQYFEEGWHVSGKAEPNKGFSPRASLVKAVILNGAVELKGIQDDQTAQVTASSAYDTNQGFGRINLVESLPIAGKNSLKGIFVDSKKVSSGSIDTYEIKIDNNKGCDEPLSVSLVWTDPPVGPMCDESCVLNDLDLSLKSDGVTYYPNGLSKPDNKNNSERIRILKPARGSMYTVHVEGKQLIEPQVYSLVITGCLEVPVDDPSTAAPSITPLPPTPLPTLSPTFLPTRSPEALGPSAGSCVDTEGIIAVEGTTRTCSWLGSQNSLAIDFWCHWVDVARVCPSTCQVCHADFDFDDVQTSAPRLDGTVRYYGNVFEVRPKVDFTLISLDLHLFGSNSVAVEVWTRNVESSSVTWSKMCEATVVSRGRFEVVPLPESDCTPTKLTAGTVSEIYITIQASKDIIMIADSTWTKETNEFTLSNGSAAAHFDAKRVAGYGFDGSLRYIRNCEDKDSSVYISDWAGDRTCAWLTKNLNRMSFICDFTEIVLHCPAACGRCPA
eukprot:scaffold528_cov165-Amphora_coffeaeformis.AAC.20